MKLFSHNDLSDIKVIGIPRGLLYYRYGVKWQAFFEALGKEVIISEPTDKAILDEGTLVSVDECCLASKAYMGHVASLIDKCDAIFVPNYASVAARAGFCTKFQSATDLVTNTFRDQNIRVISFLIEDLTNKKEIVRAYTTLGQELGASASQAKKALQAGQKAQDVSDERKAKAQEEQIRLINELRKLSEKDKAGNTPRPLAILLVAHPYLTHDHYLGGTVVDALTNMGAEVIFADETNHAKAYKASFEFSDTMPWVINRELIGSILLLQKHIDGIVLMSAFPCGPDSMTDDAIMRVIQGTPIMNLMIDAQSGTAGLETRVESFVDILRYQQKGGYIHEPKNA